MANKTVNDFQKDDELYALIAKAMRSWEMTSSGRPGHGRFTRSIKDAARLASMIGRRGLSQRM